MATSPGGRYATETCSTLLVRSGANVSPEPMPPPFPCSTWALQSSVLTTKQDVAYIYMVQHLKSPCMPPSSSVCDTAINRAAQEAGCSGMQMKHDADRWYCRTMGQALMTGHRQLLEESKSCRDAESARCIPVPYFCRGHPSTSNLCCIVLLPTHSLVQSLEQVPDARSEKLTCCATIMSAGRAST